MKIFKARSLPLLVAAMALLSACGTTPHQAKYPTGADRSSAPGGENDIYSEPDSIFGKGGLALFDTKRTDAEETGIGVNAWLWRAALDTVSFMPLANADPFGGTILTDWYAPPGTPNERLKVNVLILGKQLRSDGVRVRVFRQTQTKSGAWKDAVVSAETADRIEESILSRARQLRANKAITD